jgi:hypothetical protein
LKLSADNDEVNTEVVVEELLITTLYLDLSDEAGRQKLFLLLCAAITNAPLSEGVMRCTIKLLHKLSDSFNSLLISMLKVFDEISEAILQSPEEMRDRVQIVSTLKVLEIIHILIEYPEAVNFFYI